MHEKKMRLMKMRKVSTLLIKKKKPILLFLAMMTLALLLPLPGFAEDNQIFAIEIDVELKDNGEALVRERWKVNAQKGTEMYLVKEHLDENQMDISALQVKDETGREFTILDPWDVSASFSDKANKAGYHRTSRGIELCYGIGSYGHHSYEIQYKVKNLLVQYSDGTPGFHIRFVNDQLSADVDRVTVNIHKEGTSFTTENTKVWSFGYEGEIQVKDGAIVAQTKSPLKSWNYVNVLASFDQELFSPSFKNPKTFDEVKERAFRGSDYEQIDQVSPSETNVKVVPPATISFSDPTSYIAIGLVTFPVIAMFVLYIVLRLAEGDLSRESRKRLKQTIGLRKNDYYREPPLKSLEGSNELLTYMKKAKPQHLMSAYLLDWMRKGIIELVEKESSSFLGLVQKQETSIAGFGDKMPPTGGSLYAILVKASGDDGILQEREFYKWSKRNSAEVERWYSNTGKSGKKYLEAKGLITIQEKKKKEDTERIVHLSEKGLEKAGDLLAFEHFLKDFTLMNEREAMDVELWEEYLVYAALFGIADEVAKAFEKLQPNFFDQSSFGNNFDTTMQTLYIASTMSHAMTSGASRSSDSSSFSGGGGSSSSGGGGGYSGGGSGGGFR